VLKCLLVPKCVMVLKGQLAHGDLEFLAIFGTVAAQRFDRMTTVMLGAPAGGGSLLTPTVSRLRARTIRPGGPLSLWRMHARA